MKFLFYCFILISALVKLNFDVRYGNDIGELSTSNGAYLAKRDGSQSFEMHNNKTWYLAELKFGESKTAISVMIDTQSSDLVIASSEVRCLPDYFYTIYSKRYLDYEDSDRNYKSSWSSRISEISSGHFTDTCTTYGSFNTASSDSFHSNDTLYEFFVGDHVSRGTWGYDSVFFDDVEIKQFPFAIANYTTEKVGKLGIGLPILENTFNHRNDSYQYENFPMRLKSQGLIGKRVYSLYLNSFEAESGCILFGAVDHAKYEGTLHTVPMTKSSEAGLVVRSQVILNGLKFKSQDQDIAICAGNNFNAILDSSSTISQFPAKVYDDLAAVFNFDSLSYDDSEFVKGFGYVGNKIPCTNDPNVKIEFDFNGAKIVVPLMDLMIPTTENECVLLIARRSDFVIGQNIMRHGYFVFDLDDKEVSIAQVKIADEEDIEEVSSSVPSAVRVDSYSSTRTSSYKSYPSITAAIVATYSTGLLTVDGGYFSAAWKLSNCGPGNYQVGLISSFISLILGIIFL